MRSGTAIPLGALAVIAVLMESCSSLQVLRKHELSGSSAINNAQAFSTRLRADSNRRYSLVSCIGATLYDQRRALHDVFQLDENKSAALSGPLNPRYDLWELDNPNQCSVLLDVDIPMTQEAAQHEINPRSVLRLCKISSGVIVHLNPRDIRRSKNTFHLTRDAKELIHGLGDIAKSKEPPQIFVILPDDSIFGGYNALTEFKEHLSELLGKHPNVHIMAKGEERKVYKTIKKIDKDSSPKDIAKAITMDDQNKDIMSSALVQIKDACFAEHYRNVNKQLSQLYKGKNMPDFGSIVQASLLDAALAYYLRASHMRLDDAALNYLQYEYKRLSLSTNDAYLRILVMAEAEAKSKLRQELARDYNQDTDKLVDLVMADFNAEMEKALASPLVTCKPPEWLSDTVETMRDQLRDKLESIVTVHKGLPRNTVYSEQERALEESHAKSKKERGVNMVLSISAMLRERGYGNRQGYVNYQYGPLILTLGYANDRDIAENKPGTGILTPSFRIQPQLHVNVSL